VIRPSDFEAKVVKGVARAVFSNNLGEQKFDDIAIAQLIYLG